MSDTHGKLAPQDQQCRRSPSGGAHDESPGCIEHRTIRKIGARLGGLLSDGGAGILRVLSGKGTGRDRGPRHGPQAKGARYAQSFSVPIRDSWGSSTMLWPIIAIRTLAALPGKCRVWAVGERVHARLADAGVPLVGLFTVPNSVQAITPLVGQIQIESEAHRDKASMRLYGCSITGRCPERSMNRLASGCCRSMRNGGAIWPRSTGRRSTCPRSWATASRLCAH